MGEWLGFTAIGIIAALLAGVLLYIGVKFFRETFGGAREGESDLFVGRALELAGGGEQLDGHGFAFLKDNLEDDEEIVLEGAYRLSHRLPSFTYLCATVPIDMALSAAVYFSAPYFLPFRFARTFNLWRGIDALTVFGGIFLALFLFSSFWACLFRFVNRRKSEFVVTSKQFAVRQFAFNRRPVVCRFLWEDFVSAELYQGVLDRIFCNYTLRLKFAAFEDEPEEDADAVARPTGEERVVAKHVDVLFLRGADEVKKEIGAYAKKRRNGNGQSPAKTAKA